MNKFHQAIKADALLDFALGKGGYYIDDREYGEHSVLLSWKNYIVKSIKSEGAEETNKHIVSMFEKLLSAKELSIDEKFSTLLYHLHVYYYLRKEGNIKGEDALKDIESTIETKLHAYVITVSDQKDKAYFPGAIKTIVKNGGLQGYDKKNNTETNTLYTLENNFSLHFSKNTFVISVYFPKSEVQYKNFSLLQKEVPSDFSKLAPLADDIRNNPRLYESREIKPTIIFAGDEEQ